MAKIKIKDLPRDQKLTKADLKRIAGGAAFIKFDGVDGEAQDKDHEKWIDLLSYTAPAPRK